ncbi:hypothetical protein Tco_0470907 [Tanacetum coccineum]
MEDTKEESRMRIKMKKVLEKRKAMDEDKEVDYEILDRKNIHIIDWKTECIWNKKPQPVKINLLRDQSECEDLNAVYQLVMNKYQDEMPEGFERVLWGDLMVLFNPDEQDEFWGSQQEWKIIKKKYPLKKEILVQMLNLRLESEEESTMALELIRFIKKNKELSIPEQTATGKGTSNPLMADVAEIAEKSKLLLKRDREYKIKKR